MKVVTISDTHGRHNEVRVPDGDVLVHCGDVCGRSSVDSVAEFAVWFEKQPHQYKLVIAGNHDKHMSAKWFIKAHYLQDNGVDVNGCYFYGSPWTPRFLKWYWMKERGADIAERWNLIPEYTDVLVTHGPAADTGTLSIVTDGSDVGCRDLQLAINRTKPQLHCFGHIHEGYGGIQLGGVDYVNAGTCNLDCEPINPPIVYDI